MTAHRMEGQVEDRRGADLGVDLAELHHCGRTYLPRIAEQFEEAQARLNRVSGVQAAFSRPGTLVGGASGLTPGEVYPHWMRLRDEFERILAESAENLRATGTALIQVAEAYAAADGAARARMTNLLNDPRMSAG